MGLKVNVLYHFLFSNTSGLSWDTKYKVFDAPTNCSYSGAHNCHSKPLINFSLILTELIYHAASFIYLSHSFYLHVLLLSVTDPAYTQLKPLLAYSMSSKCRPTILMYHIKANQDYIYIQETSGKWRAFQTSLCTYGFLADSEVSLKCLDEIFNMHCELLNLVHVFLCQVV